MIALCRRAGFQRILVRGDTDFTQTQHLDRWDEAGDIGFVFGSDAHQTLKARADALPTEAYSFLERPLRYTIQTAPRQQPERIKPQFVQERGYKTIHLLEEMIAEFDYRPVACRNRRIHPRGPVVVIPPLSPLRESLARAAFAPRRPAPVAVAPPLTKLVYPNRQG